MQKSKRILHISDTLCFVLFLSIMGTILCPAKGQAFDPTNQRIQTLKRTLVVRPDFATRTLEATSTLTVSNQSEKPLSTVSVILYHRLNVRSVFADQGRKMSFEQRIVPMTGFEKMRVKHIRIALAEALLPNASCSLEIRYHGTLAGYVETGRRYVKDRVDQEFTILRLDCLAYPIVSEPSITAMMTSMRCQLNHGWDYFLEITVPKDYVVANGGKLVDKRSANGEVIYYYENIKPAWRIDVCIAKYGILKKQGTNTRLFFLPQHEAAAPRVFDAMVEATELFTAWFGPRPIQEGFAVIEVPSGYGSQTDVTCIIQEADAFKGDLHYFYHEISHLWNPRPLETKPSRFESEGLACFLEYLLAERLDDKSGNLQKALKQFRQSFRDQARRNPKLKTIPMAEYGRNDCTDASYTKGPIAFWLLYRLVGEESFINIYRTFCQEYGDQGATLEDFMATVHKFSDKDLQKFVDEWIYGTQSSEYLLGELSLPQILQLYIE